MKEFKPPRKSILYYYAGALIVLMLLNAFLFPRFLAPRVTEVPYSKLISMIDAGEVKALDIRPDFLLFKNKAEKPEFFKTGPVEDPSLITRLNDKGVEYGAPIVEQASPLMNFLMTWILPMLILFGVGQLLSRQMMKRMGGMNAMQLGKSNAKIYIEPKTGVTFKDVAGQDEAKDALKEIVDFLQNPTKYTAIGAVMPKGALLVGPPGTGKTLLAKAVAGEAGVPFFSISGSEFVEMFVGMGAAKVRDLFKQAEEKAPCIIFIDEIDTIGKKRENMGFSGNDEREQTLNQLLAEMDGFDGRTGVMLLAATNRPEVLDPALLRPGRFDRRIPVELPDMQGRLDILKVHAKKVKMADHIDLAQIAKAAVGASGADLANMINEAALRAVRLGTTEVTQADLEEAVEVVIAGYQRKSAVMTDKEKRLVAYHEIGHALVAAMLKDTAPVHKITIIPRTSGALGYTMQVEEDERYLMTREDLKNRIAILTGGRSAEEVVFDTVTTGAANDIEKATQLARAMIARFGMSDDFGMVALEQQASTYLGGVQQTGAPDTQAKIDQMTVALVKDQHALARQILRDNEALLHELAKVLLEKETLTGEEFNALIKKDEESNKTQD